jgi:hypothetical protein
VSTAGFRRAQRTASNSTITQRQTIRISGFRETVDDLAVGCDTADAGPGPA